ncbi:MAG: TGS domain-containing protein, partial [Acidobacteria bacterium]|nr:TGS domain-containing protein [Acidobacteriota bacterium]
MSLTITLPDGSERPVAPGTPVREFASGVLPLAVVKKAIAAYVNDQLVDLTHPLNADARLRLVLPDGPDALQMYRHSTAHLLAAAVTNLFPGTQCGIG